MSQLALARALGVAQPTISNWESGRSVPSETQVTRLREVLGAGEAVQQDAGPPAAHYGEWLNATRIENGLSRASLAAAAGVSALQIYNIETGRTANPRASTRTALENALGVNAPNEVVDAAEQEAEIGSGLGQLIDFDPHDESDYPREPGVYVFYDISDRPIYVGESADIRNRIRNDHTEKFWYRTPVVEKASYVRVDDQTLRRQLESTLIKFLKSNAVINKQQVVR